jgi:hypothetical protein
LIWFGFGWWWIFPVIMMILCFFMMRKCMARMMTGERCCRAPFDSPSSRGSRSSADEAAGIVEKR